MQCYSLKLQACWTVQWLLVGGASAAEEWLSSLYCILVLTMAGTVTLSQANVFLILHRKLHRKLAS